MPTTWRIRGQGVYELKIVRATHCRKREAAVVEEIMRAHVFHSTLDWQTSEEFRSGALEAYAIFKELRSLELLPREWQRLL